MLLEVRGISAAYDQSTVLDGVDLRLEEGQIGCLLGASGCGKTTVLRCIAGFEVVLDGEILADGQVISRAGFTLAPERRGIGMVFQDYALLPHLTVLENVEFGLHKLTRVARRQRAIEMITAVGLDECSHQYPYQLSGGQRQRVALARAVAPKPRLLLLDEPFSNLDVDLKERLTIELREFLQKHAITALLVTHDQYEAFAIGDRVGVMQDGAIAQWDCAYNIYHQPINRFVADFVGQGVFLPGTVVGDGRVQTELGVLEGRKTREFKVHQNVNLLLRPDDVIHDDLGPLRATVVRKAFRGAQILYTLSLPSGAVILSLVPSHHDHSIGEEIGIRLEVDHIVAFEASLDS